MDVPSSAGGVVNVEIKGVAEAIRKILEKGEMIKNGFDSNTFQAANFLQQEIQESIIGNRAEPRSVNTGNFANSINLEKIEDLKYGVYTDVDYAKFLEYGTTHIVPRQHFRNSVDRNKNRIIEIIKGV